MPPELAATAVSVGTVSYEGTDEWGQLRRDTLFCYDLEVADHSSRAPMPPLL